MAMICFLSINVSNATTEKTYWVNISTEEIPLPELNGWELYVSLGNAGVSNDVLIANNVDAIAYLKKNLTVPVDTAAVVMEFDANLDYSYWGRTVAVCIRVNGGQTLSINVGMNDSNPNKMTHLIMFNSSSSGVYFQRKLPLVYGVYHYRMIFEDELATITIINSSEETIYKKTVPATGMTAANIEYAHYKVHTTTNNPTWMKNIKFRILRKETY